MAHNTTVFRQLLDLLPRHEFDAEARRHQKGQRLRVMSRWAQFVALGLGQLAGRAHSRFPGHALTPTGVMAIRCKQFHLPDL